MREQGRKYTIIYENAKTSKSLNMSILLTKIA